MSLDEAEKLANREYIKSLEEGFKSATQDQGLVVKYAEMLSQIAKWQAPTKNHEELRNFMISQLEESVKFDCYLRDPPKKMGGEEYKASLIESAQWDIHYHSKEHKKELKYTRQRNEWVKRLKASL